ncbi:MAG: DUF5799 family protein [Halobacteriota archaeon]|uniref:DUF5799 family protein n=1 Tax=Natronomonas sp. TaxID=2184060 RepID=UPI0039759CF1
MTDWQDMVVGDRMTVDGEFASRVESSPFTRQEWGLIMTATTFEIENPTDEEAAKIVARTDQLRGMMPEIEKVSDMTPMGTPQSESDSGGIFGSIRDILGLGDSGGPDGVDEDRLGAAKRLVSEYAEALQAHLESQGRWDEIRAAAAENDE